VRVAEGFPIVTFYALDHLTTMMGMRGNQAIEGLCTIARFARVQFEEVPLPFFERADGWRGYHTSGKCGFNDGLRHTFLEAQGQ
jgi:hypothetical protein